MRRLVLFIAILIGCAAALQPLAAAATQAALFGMAEVRAASYAALPQWARVMHGMARDAAVVRACAGDRRRCPNPATAAWLDLLHGLAQAPAARQLDAVNRFVNRSVYVTDAANYGLRDYWATPLEFFVRSGDCEDYAIAKYQSLRLLGWPPEALRLVVVQDVIRDLPHAVLAAYLADAVYILDNLSDTALEQSQVKNYMPYYSVNEITRWAHLAPDRLVAGGSPADVQPARP